MLEEKKDASCEDKRAYCRHRLVMSTVKQRIYTTANMAGILVHDGALPIEMQTPRSGSQCVRPSTRTEGQYVRTQKLKILKRILRSCSEFLMGTKMTVRIAKAGPTTHSNLEMTLFCRHIAQVLRVMIPVQHIRASSMDSGLKTLVHLPGPGV
jgi:hypothetical protein